MSERGRRVRDPERHACLERHMPRPQQGCEARRIDRCHGSGIDDDRLGACAERLLDPFADWIGAGPVEDARYREG